MQSKTICKSITIILIPLLLGIIIDNVNFISRIYSNYFWYFAVISILFWFWSGKIYAKLITNKLKALLIGNSLWLICFIFCLWIYWNESIPYRSFILDRFAQYYTLPLTPLTTAIVKTFVGILSGRGLLKISYILMFIIFYSGFTYEIVKTTKLIRNSTPLIILCISVIFLLPRFPFHAHVSGYKEAFTETSPKQLEIPYSNYSTLGFSIYSTCISKGSVSWKIINPKGEIILSGIKSSEEKIYSSNIDHYLENEPIRSSNEPPIYFMIPSPSIPGKYTIKLELNNASGYFSVGWDDTASPLM